MLGIKGYQPQFSTTALQFIGKHKRDLQKLIGERITSYYLQWELKEDKWNEDGPILLQIGANQYEFTAYRLDEYSLTVNKIDLSAKLDWYESGDDMPLIWKENPVTELNVILNRKIEEIHLLEYSMTADIVNDEKKKEFFQQLTDSEFFIIGIEFKLSGLKDHLQFSNGLDCNAIKIETTLLDGRYRRIRVQ